MTVKSHAPKISVIIPVRNCPNVLRVCINSLQNSTYGDYEIIVVDDASTDRTPELATTLGITLLRLERQCGPASARNRGAEIARGEYLFFVDADVRIHPETINQVVECFEQNPEIEALFGSYDLAPQAFNILSQYKNLFHHFVHQQGRPKASTFWSGCGAIKRSIFVKMRGFNPRYARPCIEDIELGARLYKEGHRIMLKKDIQVTHLKRWTLWNMLKADVKDRGIPWTELILRERNLPNDLNLKFSQRLSAILAYGILAAILIEGWHTPALLLLPIGVLVAILGLDYWSEKRRVPTTLRALAMIGVLGAIAAISYYGMKWLMLALAFLAGIILLNFRFYVFFARVRGHLFAALVIPLHVFYYLYSGASFVLGVGLYFWKTRILGLFKHRGLKTQAETMTIL